MMDYQAELATARAEIKRLTAERGGLQAKIDHFIKESLETLTKSEAELEKLKIAVKAERDAAVVQGLEIAQPALELLQEALDDWHQSKVPVHTWGPAVQRNLDAIAAEIAKRKEPA
jgi:hypothetical protein